MVKIILNGYVLALDDLDEIDYVSYPCCGVHHVHIIVKDKDGNKVYHFSDDPNNSHFNRLLDLRKDIFKL